MSEGEGSLVDNLLGMARTAEMAGNNAEALSYFNRVLELDPRCSDAWVGKGKAAGWQSTLQHVRLAEAQVAFGHAVATAAPDRRADVLTQTTEATNAISLAVYRLARDHLAEYSAVDGVWASYLGTCGELLSASEEAADRDPGDVRPLAYIEHICRDNIQGFAYTDRIHNYSGVHTITPEYAAILTAQRERAIQRIKAIVPTYEVKSITKEKAASACFVITASLGDADHPDVKLLQRYRDERLRLHAVGRATIRAYWRVGPPIAALISRHALLGAVGRLVIVRPAATFARRQLGQ